MNDSIYVLGPGGEAFKNRVMKPAMFRAYTLVKMPVLGVTGATLKALDVSRCEAVLPYCWTSKNMFGAMTSGAALAAAQIASACLWVVNIRNQGASLTPVPVSITIEAPQLIKEELTFVCLEGDRYPEAVASAARGEAVEEEVTIEGINDSGQTLCQVRITWRLDPKS